MTTVVVYMLRVINTDSWDSRLPGLPAAQLRDILLPRSTLAEHGPAQQSDPAVLAFRLRPQQTYRHRTASIFTRAISQSAPVYLSTTRRVLDRGHALDQSKLRQYRASFLSDVSKGQIEDLQAMSREYERHETIRMGRSNGQQNAHINEPIPVARRT